MTKNTLETYVQNYRLEILPREETKPEKHTKPMTEMVTFRVKSGLALKLRKVSKRNDFEALIEEFLHFVERKTSENMPEPTSVTPGPTLTVQSQAANEGQPQKFSTEPRKPPSRHIPAKIKRFVQERTGGLCAYPSCLKPSTSLHHAQRWALEKTHDPLRLHPLCTGHERLAHQGLIDQEEEKPNQWKLREHPDKNHPKFFIDSQVAEYRPSG